MLKLIEVTVPPELALAIAKSAIGIAKEWADELIREGRPAIIEGDA
ncbi:protein of unassigned function [Methylobacterium oryzae CBMB20]|uniref:Protein of unassigned function n=1 Tax=Methylobacterium oryzae CBMB20 TaxID=693986 RepID=A0A089NKD5_9HYPH|nr:protein of unassigned function [Methylobacterium oryzae CBMB20]